MAEPVIRPMRPEDAQDCYEIRTSPGVIRGTLQLPTLSLERVRSQALANSSYCKLVAEIDGKVVGITTIYRMSGREQHCGAIGLSVHDDYQGRGLGRRLMAAILDVADNWLMLERVELGVYPDNERAVHLYRSFGFEEEGISPAIALRDGELVSMLSMARLRGRAAIPATLPPPPPRPAAGTPPAHLKIRGVQAKDVDALHALYLHPAVTPSLKRLPSLQVDELRNEIAALGQGHHMTVAEVDGQVIGAAYLMQFTGRRGHSGFIRSLAVHPDWQGRGVGAALLDFLLDLGERWLGLTRIETEVQACDSPALGLFQSRGFQCEAVRRSAITRGGQFMDVQILGRVTAR